VDGKRVPVTEVTPWLLRLDLRADNIFGCRWDRVAAYLSVADGWVALSHPLTPRTHTITLDVAGEFHPGTPLVISNKDHDHPQARQVVGPPTRCWARSSGWLALAAGAWKMIGCAAKARIASVKAPSIARRRP
jgi:hypothetical protein